MIAYMIIDDQNGTMFNHRRQSQDRILRQNMLKDCTNSRLWISEYSKSLFLDESGAISPNNVIVDNLFMEKAEDNDCCFIEDIDITSDLERIDTLVLYKWNCSYPADTFFDTSFLNIGWKKFSLNHFKGSSHNKIFKEVWKRV